MIPPTGPICEQEEQDPGQAADNSRSDDFLAIGPAGRILQLYFTALVKWNENLSTI